MNDHITNQNTIYTIEAKQVSKSYGDLRALDKVSLHVRKGSIYGLIGDNGAGKSTFLKLLAEHIFPTSGEIRLFGQYEEKELLRCRRQTGIMIEQPGFFPNMTVENTLEYYRIQKRIPGIFMGKHMLPGLYGMVSWSFLVMEHTYRRFIQSGPESR